MELLLNFIAENPWQVFFAGPFTFAVFTMLAIIIAGIFTSVFKTLNRILRSINILFRGWPPEYLDADGDSTNKTALNRIIAKIDELEKAIT